MRLLPVATVGLGLLLLGGCATAETAITAQPRVAICAFSEPASPVSQSGEFYFLGAGDALGSDIYTVYLASLRGTDLFHYATAHEFHPQ